MFYIPNYIPNYIPDYIPNYIPNYIPHIYIPYTYSETVRRKVLLCFRVEVPQNDNGENRRFYSILEENVDIMKRNVLINHSLHEWTFPLSDKILKEIEIGKNITIP